MASVNIVDWDAMGKAHTAFQSSYESAQTQYKAAQGIVERLEAGWGGETSTAYLGALDNWLQKFKVNTDMLGQLSNNVSSNKNQYIQGNQTNQGAAAKLASQINL